MNDALQRQIDKGSLENILLTFDDQKVRFHLRPAQEHRKNPVYVMTQINEELWGVPSQQTNHCNTRRRTRTSLWH